MNERTIGAFGLTPLLPAYGRDHSKLYTGDLGYEAAEEADALALIQIQKDMDSNEDFRSAAGPYCNREDLLRLHGEGRIQIRWGDPRTGYPRTGTVIVRNEIPAADPGDEGTDRIDEQAWADELSDDELEAYVYDSVVDTADGCRVEPDGSCPHGYSSPLILRGLI